MKNLWADFRAFALGGNMIDLALGFIIGAAFAGLVESLAKNIIMDTIAALGGAPDTSQLTFTLNGGKIHYGTFLGDALAFVILAAVLFGMVKLMMRAGMGNFKAQGQVECEHCKEFISVDADRCKHCTSHVMPSVAD